MEQLLRDNINFEHKFFDYQIFGNSIYDLLISLSLCLILIIIFRIFRKICLVKLSHFVKTTETSFDDELFNVLERIHPRFYDFIACYIAIKSLNTPETFDHLIHSAFILIVIVQGTLSIQGFLEYVLGKLLHLDTKYLLANNRDLEEGRTIFKGLSLFLRIVLWISAFLLLLSNLGFNINSLATSLGIGGIAVALAVQNILGDIFSSFTIYFDKPFVIGDFINIGTDMGTVKKIGLKTTRLESLQGEEIIISNKELTSVRVQNFKKMEKRRIVFSIGLVYETSSEKLKEALRIINDVFKDVGNADLDRAHFKEFADFSLNLEVVYYHLSGDYKEYMNVRQEINFLIKQEFEKADIQMAFPTQTLYIHKENSSEA